MHAILRIASTRALLRPLYLLTVPPAQAGRWAGHDASQTATGGPGIRRDETAMAVPGGRTAHVRELALNLQGNGAGRTPGR